MATDTTDDREMREAQRDYLDFLDDDVSDASPPLENINNKGHSCAVTKKHVV